MNWETTFVKRTLVAVKTWPVYTAIAIANRSSSEGLSGHTKRQDSGLCIWYLQWISNLQ